MCFLNPNRQSNSSSASIQLISTRTGTTIKRLKSSTLRRSIGRTTKTKATGNNVNNPTVTWNLADDDDITVLESTSNHLPTPKVRRGAIIRRQQQQQQRGVGTPLETVARRTRAKKKGKTRMKTLTNHLEQTF